MKLPGTSRLVAEKAFSFESSESLEYDGGLKLDNLEMSDEQTRATNPHD